MLIFPVPHTKVKKKCGDSQKVAKPCDLTTLTFRSSGYFTLLGHGDFKQKNDKSTNSETPETLLGPGYTMIYGLFW